jgi:type I restriction enzyme S subunit
MNASRIAERGASYALQTALEPTFGTSFDLLATARQGVAKLRSLVLSLAVQGQLTAREAHDDSANALASRLRDVRSNAQPSRGQHRDPQKVEDDFEKPCALPCGWVWTRLSELGDFRSGKTPSTGRSEYWNGSYPWVSPKDMKELIITSTQDWVTEKALEDGLSLVPENSILVVVRSGILRRMVPVAVTGVPCTVNQDIKALCLLAPEMARYVQLMIQGFESFILDRLTKVGTTVESIKFDEFAQQPFPLPPRAEQARIVARVEELMQLCDALEAHGRLQDEQHARLVATLFDALAASASAEELAENWQRIATHFDLLLDRPEAVDALEQTLLQLAVRGLLAPQEPTDEPASKLLRRICIEKDHLIAEGKIKRAKSLPPISDEEKSFELPTGWEWVRAGSVGVTQTGGTPASNKPEYFNGNFPFIGPGQITPSGEILPPEKFISELGRSESAVAEPGDILMVCIGGSIGKCAAVSFPTAFNQQINSIRPLLASSEFILTAMTTSDFVSKVVSTATGSATPIISKGKWDLLLLPLPPLAEQHRIVARVEQLRRLCTELRERLQQARATQSRLADALVSAAPRPPAC